MPREYRHIKMYKQQLYKLREEGLTQREIAEKLGFTKEQVKEFFKRERANQRKLEAGIALKKRGRPLKDCKATNTDKVSELKYTLARKEAKIKQLEMENELMRDFLSLTERK